MGVRVLPPDDVGRLLEAAPGPGLKYKAALSIAYGAGLRGGEVVMLRVSDIDSRRMLGADAHAVTFKYNDDRFDGPGRYKTMTVHPQEFIRRFLIHVLPKGLHRIRHYGLLANGKREANIAKARELLRVETIDPADDHLRRADAAEPADAPAVLPRPCPCCGAHMLVIETFAGVCRPRPHA